MKAKQYAERFAHEMKQIKDRGDKTEVESISGCISDILIDMHRDARELIEVRKVRSGSALAAIYREVLNKFTVCYCLILKDFPQLAELRQTPKELFFSAAKVLYKDTAIDIQAIMESY